ncbi:MAG TPA: HEAT repeat domain-containing protein [Bryobacteraceae bacterium]|nr:HEAT repeat domain-containing protein [Bryobacteraceae bacterium]
MRNLLLVSMLWPATVFCQAAPAPINRDRQCRDILDQALIDKNPDTRKQAAIALSLVGSTGPFADQLQMLLDDKDVEVRLAAIASLTEMKGPRTIPALHKALNDDVPEVSFAAARSLFALNDPEGKKALLSIVSGESKASSGYFAKQKRDALRMMHTPKTTVLFAVKQGAGFAPVPGLGVGISSLQALLSDPSVSGRATALLLIDKDKDEQTLDAIKDALYDKDWSVRAAAVHALVLRDQPALEADITPLLDDKSQPVRLRAAAGFLRLEEIKHTPRTARRRTGRRPAAKAIAPKSQP